MNMKTRTRALAIAIALALCIAGNGARRINIGKVSAKTIAATQTISSK